MIHLSNHILCLPMKVLMSRCQMALQWMCRLVPTCLTTLILYLLPSPPIMVQSLTTTSLLTLNMSQMPLHGGMSTALYIPAFQGWRLIIFLSQVHTSFFLLAFFLLLTSLLATSIDVERLFSHGWLLLSHVRSRLSVDSTQALLCLGAWSHLGLIKNEDVLKVGVLPEVDEEDEMEGGISLD